jgi:hypothetical protein
VVLRSDQGLDTLAVRHRNLLDVASHRSRPDEGDRLDIGVSEKPVDGHAIAVEHVHHSRWEARLVHQFGHVQGSSRILLRRLGDEGVAGGNRYRKHPEGHHRGRVEGGDPHSDTERPADVVDVYAGRGLFGETTGRCGGDSCGELDVLETPGNFTIGVGERLAVLSGDASCDLISIRVDEFPESICEVGTSGERCCPPGRERSYGGMNRGVGLRK